MQRVCVVWFKRDLRLSDHQALANAVKRARDIKAKLILLYVFEPLLLNDPHHSERHWRFVTESITDLNFKLRQHKARISVAHGDAIKIFGELTEKYILDSVYSHQEVGLENTYRRDKALHGWLVKKCIAWHESQSGAVQRGLKTREYWDKDWSKFMRAPIADIDLSTIEITTHRFNTTQLPEHWKTPDPIMQRGGSRSAWNTLSDFFDQRGKDYAFHISKPSQSRIACSRMSPYLAWGNISLREFYQTLLQHWNRKGWRRSLTALSSRLHWHCHFIQKFESECAMEKRSVNHGYEQFPYRGKQDCLHDLTCWQQGQTGFPLVDATMRCLIETGYINFRMRAMLVSFLCHHLQIDWRLGADHLAQLFLDFEPGIHYPQFQMQAGVTGINTIRIYNPTKQALEHDANAVFIKKWCPELSALPTPLIFEPWRLTPMEETMYEITLGEDYPQPIVDLSESYRNAQQLLWSWRKRPAVKADAKRILKRHVRA